MNIQGKLLVALLAIAPAASAQSPEAVQQRIAAVKQTLQTSAQALHALEWIETTTVTVKGEQKAQILKKCYYGMDGKIQKVPVLPPGGKPNEKLEDFVESAVSLLQKYVPPDPALIQRAVDHGKISIQVLDPGKAAALVFSDYILTGDKLSLALDLTKPEGREVLLRLLGEGAFGAQVPGGGTGEASHPPIGDGGGPIPQGLELRPAIQGPPPAQAQEQPADNQL